ncbi:hypothetical protein BTUL_0107g00230 [Botrytis tulipae]|uniref:Uncharacterized protein n=1 Tax=Botrytis tulipae TaxID=87230 RepID=A0A4Z1EK45_9HELO|nr:hypothetical protein BTUL_0107g00230 [Botrytis tulipae]
MKSSSIPFQKISRASINLLELYFGYSDGCSDRGFGDRESGGEKICGRNVTAIKISWDLRFRIAVEPVVARYIRNADFSTYNF